MAFFGIKKKNLLSLGNTKSSKHHTWGFFLPQRKDPSARNLTVLQQANGQTLRTTFFMSRISSLRAF